MQPDYGVGWPIFPDIFRDELIEVTERYGLPVYITENGCGGSDDMVRRRKAG